MNKPLDTWGLMYAKSNFYDSTNIFEVPSPLQSNNTWHLGANARSSASFSSLNRSVKYFEGGFHSKSTDSLMLKINRSLGTMGQVLFLSSNDSEVKVSTYILSLHVIPFLS